MIVGASLGVGFVVVMVRFWILDGSAPRLVLLFCDDLRFAGLGFGGSVNFI